MNEPKTIPAFTREAIEKADREWEQFLIKRQQDAAKKALVKKRRRPNRNYPCGKDHRYYGIPSKEHPCYDHTVYHLQHKDGEVFIGHQNEFRKKYNLGADSVSLLVNGKQKTHKGWKLCHTKLSENDE